MESFFVEIVNSSYTLSIFSEKAPSWIFQEAVAGGVLQEKRDLGVFL